MSNIANKLLAVQSAKSSIKDAIIAKGIPVDTGTPFSEYAEKISDIASDKADQWIRPTEWLALPDNVDGVQKVSILNAVFDTDSEFVAFACGGAYTVDWGDGTVEDFTGVKAEHKYDYTNVNLNNDTVAAFGYKQCIITITPQAGQNLSNITLNTFHSTIGSNENYDFITGFLDMRINASLCTNLIIGLDNASVKHTMLEQCLIGELASTMLSNLFYDCYALQSVSIKDTSNVITFAYTHCNNYSLQKMPLYTFRSAGVAVNNMFSSCYNLKETYPVNVVLSSVVSVNNMFSNCKSLRYVDLTITSSVDYTLVNTFYNCSALVDIKLTQTGTGKVTSLSQTFTSTRIEESPVLDTSACTLFSNAFQSCERLVKLQTYDYSVATNLSAMLSGCFSLKSVPNFNITTSCTNLSSLCNNCYSLEKAPTFSNSSGVTNISGMFANCISLTNIPSYVFGNITSSNMSSFLSGCTSLQSVPSITVGTTYTSNSNFIAACYSLKRMLMPLRFTFSVVNAKMSAAALNEMYNILPSVTNQTVTVTGNYGATSTPVVTLSNSSITEGSKTVTVSNTTGLSVGMFISGSASMLGNNGRSCNFTDNGGLVTAAGHSLIDGDIVSFTRIAGAPGINIKTIYYVVNATTDTFQLSLTQGGSVIDLVASAGDNGNYISPAFITAITLNSSIEVSLPMVSTGTDTITCRSNDHKTYLATMKGWTVTG